MDGNSAVWTGSGDSTAPVIRNAGSNAFYTKTSIACACSAPNSFAVDGAGNIWVGNANNTGTISEISSAGILLSPNGFGNGIVDTTYQLAVDGSGNVWAGSDGDGMVEYIGIASPTTTPVSAAVKAGTIGVRP